MQATSQRLVSPLAKKLLVGLLSLLLVYATSIALLVLAEHSFFNQVLYRKSPLHGYTYQSVEKNPDWISAVIINRRLKDIHLLLENYFAHSVAPELSNSQPTEQNAFTIAVIGDSYSYGTGVRLNQTYPFLLEQTLNYSFPTKVYNFSQTGDSLSDHRAKYELIQKVLKPDLIIVTLTHNDLLYEKTDKYPEQSQLFAAAQVTCDKPLFSYQRLPQNSPSFLDYFDQVIYPTFNDNYSNSCIAKELLSQMNHPHTLFFALDPLSRAESHTLSSIPPFSAHSTNADNPYLFSAAMREIEKITNSLETSNPLIIMSDELSDFWSPVTSYEKHPSAQTHRHYADVLTVKVLASKQWNSKINKSE